ncbi:MAG: DoxX family protein [Candidatus Sericytochromatia bacterium]|nr:DoxX family protein [Candidatus Sericytochromatia bacterium]
MSRRDDAPKTQQSGLSGILDSLAPTAHAVLRIGAGCLFLEHGLVKLFGWITNATPVPLMSLMGLAGVLETVGGVMLILGLLTRPVAFILTGQMVVAYLMVHAPQGLWPIQNKGELALLYALIFAFLATHGAGPLSLDRLRHRRRP